MTKEYSGPIIPLMAGACAGTCVDITLYPLDTIKTRLQSSSGFLASGGFNKIYSGIGPVALGSAPGAAVFFCVYEISKKYSSLLPTNSNTIKHSIAASFGELAACLVRVPTEVIKQRRQFKSSENVIHIFRKTLREEKFIGFYRGYWATVRREIPFSIIQYPLWELLKEIWSTRQGYNVLPYQGAICGAFSGLLSAAVTTPLDVAKTRIMLAHKGTQEARGQLFLVLKNIYSHNGIKGLFAGVLPRSMLMFFGGAIYFGAYEVSSNYLFNKK